MLGKLAEAIDELGSLDVTALSDDELHELVVGLRRLRCSTLIATESRLVAEWDARKAWSADGSRSGAARLARETGANQGVCAVEVRRARSLRTMPFTFAALADGR